MMRKIFIVSVILCSITFSGFSQTLSKETICKKWYLHHYEHLWIDYEPEAKEKNDYIQFNTDMTYVSVDEGKKSSGKWLYSAKDKYILMYNEKGKNIKLFIEDLDSDALVFEIDDKELKGVEIHYSRTKNQ